MKRIKSRIEKKNFFRNIGKSIVVLLVLVVFFKGIFVNAGMNDSKLEKNRMEGIYAVTNINGQSRLFYLNMYTMNGIPSYCIEPGVDITTDIYHSTNDFGMSMLSDEEIEYIRSISYFGYQYEGHNDYRYYMAAQELIWEYVGGIEVEWSSQATVDGLRIPIDSFKDEILLLRDNYYKGLSLRFQNGSSYRVGDKLVIYDKSGMLSYYEIETSGYSNAWIEGNALHVEVARDYVGEERIVLKRKEAYSYSSKLYYYDSSQRLISAGNFLDKREIVYFNIEGVSLNFQLVDSETLDYVPSEQTSFSGTVYEFYNTNGDYYNIIEFGDYGKGFVDNLPFGSYIVRQLVPGEGYLHNDMEIFLELNESQSFYLLEQYVIKQDIEIFKTYNYQGIGKMIPEEGVIFSIYDWKGNFYDEVITDKNGIASIELSYGNYRIIQKNTSFGYEKVDDFEIFVDSVGEMRYDLIDNFIECELKVILKDLDFENVNLGKGFLYKIFDVKNDKYLEYDGEFIFSTDNNGELKFPVLVGYGEYIIEQVGVPIGYQEKNISKNISINDNSNFIISEEKLQLVVEFEQELKLGTVNIFTKKEEFIPLENNYEYKLEDFPNVDLELVAGEDIIVYDNTLYKKGDSIGTFTTDEEGKENIYSLYLVSYCLREKVTGVQKCFSFKDNFIESVNLNFELKKMDIQFINLNEFGEDIIGSIIEVKDENNKVIYTGITDELGSFKVLGLSSGRYCFSQKKVNTKYLIYNDDVCLEMDDSKDIWEVKMINLLSPKRVIEVPDTFFEGVDLKKVLVLILLILGVIFYKKKIFSNFYN